MAPELVLGEVGRLDPGQTLLDPMCGSGTVLRLGVIAGLRVLGRDIDPLSVLMASVWTTKLDRSRYLHDAHALLERCGNLRKVSLSRLKWMDEETQAFVRFWFAEPQLTDLCRLSIALSAANGPTGNALRVAFSRLIITKDRGASLARDISHSRPHKTRETVNFPVNAEFMKSVREVSERLRPESIRGTSHVSTGDSRDLSDLRTGTVDSVVTSPPT